jgi:hypothetical protein
MSEIFDIGEFFVVLLFIISYFWSMLRILLFVVLLVWTGESFVTLYHRCFYYTNITVGMQSIPYCLQSPVDSTETENCSADSVRYTFEELSRLGFDVDDLLQWHVPMDTVENYALYKDELPLSIRSDQFICNCSDPSTFGPSCQYKLYFGETIGEAMTRQFQVRERNPASSQWHERRTCYEPAYKCDFGLLCLDWREICDGKQDCIDGRDEEHCEKLEFNECEEDEYRCSNGMCIPGEYFLDGKAKHL